jgi:hypothetical protein
MFLFRRGGGSARKAVFVRGVSRCVFMAVPRFIFHIGAHKTGTTFLQTVFRTLAPALRGQGVLEPDTWHRLPHQPGHHQLPIDLAEGASDSLTRGFAEIMDSGCSEVLISAEGLSTLRGPAVALLGSLVKGADVSIVFYCRRWSDYLPSHWQTLVRGGIVETMPDNLRPLLIEPARHAAVNFGLKLDAYARVFGRERISIASYSNIVDSGMNLAHHFFEAFLPAHRSLLDEQPDAVEQSKNKSLTTPETEMIRGLNALARKHGERRSAGPSGWFMRYVEEADRERIRTMIEPARRVMTVDDSSARLRALHDTLFQEWGDRVVEPRLEGGFFKPRVRELPFISPGRATAPVVERELLGLYDQYRRDAGLAPRVA